MRHFPLVMRGRRVLELRFARDWHQDALVVGALSMGCAMARMVVDALPSLAYVVVMRCVGAQYADVSSSVWLRDKDVVVYPLLRAGLSLSYSRARGPNVRTSLPLTCILIVHQHYHRPARARIDPSCGAS